MLNVQSPASLVANWMASRRTTQLRCGLEPRRHIMLDLSKANDSFVRSHITVSLYECACLSEIRSASHWGRQVVPNVWCCILLFLCTLDLMYSWCTHDPMLLSKQGFFLFCLLLSPAICDTSLLSLDPPPPQKKKNLKLVRIIFVLSRVGEENDVEIQWTVFT